MSEEKIRIFNIERFAVYDGPGIRTTVFLQGCPLRCQWCANPESQTMENQLLFMEQKCVGCGRCSLQCPRQAITIADGKAHIERKLCMKCGRCAEICPNEAVSLVGNDMTPEDIYSVVIRDKDYYEQSSGGLTLSGGDPLMQLDALMPLLIQCRNGGISVAVETCGSITQKTVEAAFPFIDYFLFDIKSMDREVLWKYTRGNYSLIMENYAFIAACDAEKLITRVPVIPGVNNTMEHMERLFQFVREHGGRRVDLLPYHTLGVVKYRQLGLDYSFLKTSLMREDLIPFRKRGEELGLTITIGGRNPL